MLTKKITGFQVFHINPGKKVSFGTGWLKGQDPTRIIRKWQAYYRGSRYPLGTATTAALSAVEQALWDISGKACELPVYKMLGGFFRDKIKVYGSGYLAQPSHFDLDKAPLVESCKATVDAGFSAIKITPQPDNWQKKTAKQIFRDSVEHVRRVREAGGRTVHKQGTASGIGVKRSGPYPPA